MLSGVLARVGRVGFPLTCLSVVVFRVGSSALTEVSLGCVKAGVEVLGLAVVGAVLYVNLSFRVALVGLTIADEVRSLALIGATLVPSKVILRTKADQAWRCGWKMKLCCLGQHTNGR